MRRGYEDSCRALQQAGWLDPGALPRLPDRPPRHDDEPVAGVCWFREEVTGDFSGLTLPRTFIGRARVADASFANTDLTESVLCWTAFERVDFSGCDLSGADLRRSTFDGCEFTGAVLRGTKLYPSQRAALGVGGWDAVDWQDEGVEPPGG
ncbi:MAG: pentapeptide repeat-containing protein [Myxococcota bacterium]